MKNTYLLIFGGRGIPEQLSWVLWLGVSHNTSIKESAGILHWKRIHFQGWKFTSKFTFKFTSKFTGEIQFLAGYWLEAVLALWVSPLGQLIWYLPSIRVSE